MSTILSRVQDTGLAARDRGLAVLDSQLPPERRAELQSNIHSWSNQNPKLATFLFIQAALILPPLTLFTIFSITVLTTSLTVTLLTALFVTIAITSLAVTGALVLLLPALFLAVGLGTFLFTTGFVTYAIVNKFNTDPRTENVRTTAKQTAQNAVYRANEISDGRLELVNAMVDKNDRAKAVDAMRSPGGTSANGIVPVDDGHSNGSAVTTATGVSVVTPGSGETRSLHSPTSSLKDYRVASAGAMGGAGGRTVKTENVVGVPPMPKMPGTAAY